VVRDDGIVDAERTRVLMDLLASTGWVDAARDFAGGLRRSALTSSGQLLLVGTPNFEPWHFAAHLTDEAQFAGLPELTPLLVRWQVPPGASSHLAIPLQRLEIVGRGETLLVVTDEAAPDPLLERAWDARKAGATVLALDTGSEQLASVAHDSLELPTIAPALLSFDAAQHIVSVAAGEAPASSPTGRGGAGGPGVSGSAAQGAGQRMRGRLAKLLDRLSGPPPDRDW